MNRQRIRSILSLLAIGAAVVLFVRAGAGQWRDVQRASVHLQLGWLSLSYALNLVAFLMDTFALHQAYRAIARRPELFTMRRAIALYNISSLLKYLPGRVWALVSQVERGTRGGLEGDALVQANILCTLVVTATGLLMGSVFLWTYGAHSGKPTMCALSLAPLAVAVTALIVYRFSPVAMRKLMSMARRPIPAEWRIPTDRQLVWLIALYVVNWGLAGVGGVCAWMAFGAPKSFAEAVLVASSMGAGWTVAVMAVIAPGGLGVREGAIFWMLNASVGKEVALILPVLTRLIYMVCEASLGTLGFVLARQAEDAVGTSRPT